MKSRVITAVIILGVLIPIIYLSALAFKIMALILVAVAVHELIDVKKDRNYSMLTKGLLYLINMAPLLFINDFSSLTVVALTVILVLFALIMLVDNNVNFDDIGYLFITSLFIIMASNGAMYLRNLEDGFYIVIFVILVTAASDTGAFFTGNAYGKHKLMPRISPNKTVEGLAGGIVASIVAGLIYSFFLPTGLDQWYLVILASALFGVMAAVGDLFFSAIKRTNNVKDFSNMLPGHGGILDRIDSHLMNLLVCFALFVFLKG